MYFFVRTSKFIATFVFLVTIFQNYSNAENHKDGLYDFTYRYGEYREFYRTNYTNYFFDGSKKEKNGSIVRNGGANIYKFPNHCFNKLKYTICRVNGKWKPTFDYNTVKYKNQNSKTSCHLIFNGDSIFYNSNTFSKWNTWQSWGHYYGTGVVTVSTTFSFSNVKITENIDEQYNALVKQPRQPPYKVPLGGKQRIQKTTVFRGSPSLIRVGPANKRNCSAPRFRVVALNPYWLYPIGTKNVSLNRIAGEINAPGSDDIARRNNGTPVATHVAADGVSSVIIGVRTLDSDAPVTFSLSRSDRGSLKPLNRNFFRDGASGTRALEVSEFTDIPDADGAVAFAAVYVAPDNLEDPRGKSVDVVVKQNGKKRKLKLFLVSPPVVLAHGLWSNQNVWDSFVRNFDSNSFPLIRKINYDSDHSFSNKTNQSIIDNYIFRALAKLRHKGTVAAQVDVVGHSMGGLAARSYAQDKLTGIFRTLRRVRFTEL